MARNFSNAATLGSDADLEDFRPFPKIENNGAKTGSNVEKISPTDSRNYWSLANPLFDMENEELLAYNKRVNDLKRRQVKSGVCRSYSETSSKDKIGLPYDATNKLDEMKKITRINYLNQHSFNVHSVATEMVESGTLQKFKY